MSALLTGLGEVAREALVRARADLGRHGIQLDPRTQVVMGEGMLSWYDAEDLNIHISLPDLAQPLGVLQALFFRQMLGLRDNAELDRFIRLVLPWLMAHEVGHALRHQAGLFGADPWLEEQIANQFASALTRRQTPPSDREELLGLLRRVVQHLRQELGAELGVDSHQDAHHALGVAGRLTRGTVRSLEAMESIFALAPESILREAHGRSPELEALLERRQATIRSFREEYARSAMRYSAFQLGWLLISWEGAELHHIEELAERHLARRRPRLGALRSVAASDAQVRACAAAWRSLEAAGHPLSLWFYKRYRRQLLELVAASGEVAGGDFDREEQRIAEERDEEEPGTLDLLAAVAPPGLRGLFPARLPPEAAPQGLEPVEQELYDAALGRPASPAAQETQHSLQQLLRSSFYGSLPATTLYELAREALPLHLGAGEGLTSQGAQDDDVYVIASGRLQILVAQSDGATPSTLGELGAGEVVGEIAFLSGEPRSATLVALEPTLCLVLRAHALRLLSYAHPELLLRLGHLLARRLREANQRIR